jgi:hypothetical protein
MAEIGKELILAATDNHDTEIVAIDNSGVVLSRRVISGRYQIVRSIRESTVVRLIGGIPAGDRTILLSLDSGLNEIGRTQGLPHGDFDSKVSVQIGDSSIMLVGNTIHKQGDPYRPGVAQLNETLSDIELFSLVQDVRFFPNIIEYGAPNIDCTGVVTIQRRVLRQASGNAGGHARIDALINVFQVDRSK